MVSTPIGNLQDLSPRSLEILKSVDLLACEDTRHSQKLLMAFDIKKKLIALHAHNEYEQAARIIAELKESNQSMAFISDAGTPGISDPGAELAREAHLQGVPVFAGCGPSALAAALSASGFNQKDVFFTSFFPRKDKERLATLEKALSITPCTLVFFESPKRILDTTKFLSAHLNSNTPVCISREISKIYESHRVSPLGALEQILLTEPIRGEFVLSLSLSPELQEGGKFTKPVRFEESLQEMALRALRMRDERTESPTLRELSRQIAIENGSVSSRDIYQMALKIAKEKENA